MERLYAMDAHMQLNEQGHVVIPFHSALFVEFHVLLQMRRLLEAATNVWYYYNGQSGLPKDLSKALELWHRAGELGNADAHITTLVVLTTLGWKGI